MPKVFHIQRRRPFAARSYRRRVKSTANAAANACSGARRVRRATFSRGMPGSLSGSIVSFTRWPANRREGQRNLIKRADRFRRRSVIIQRVQRASQFAHRPAPSEFWEPMRCHNQADPTAQSAKRGRSAENDLSG